MESFISLSDGTGTALIWTFASFFQTNKGNLWSHTRNCYRLSCKPGKQKIALGALPAKGSSP